MGQLEQVIRQINKKFGAEVITKGVKYPPAPKIPFSSPRINYMLYGGIPLGKAVEFFGEEGGGKTTTALDVVGNFQKLYPDRVAVYVDAENTLDIEWATKIGADVEKMVLVRPQDQTAEDVLQMILSLLDTGEAGLVVLDSLPMLVPQALYDKDLEKKSYAGVSGVMSEFCRRVSPRLAKNLATLIIINQMRADINNPFNIYHTPGGKALKHLYALRMYFRRGSYIDANNNEIPNKSENPAGNMVDVAIAKTKICRPDRRVGQYTLNYYSGIDVLADAVFIAIHFDIIQQAGSWFSAPDVTEQRWQGKAKMLEWLKDNPDAVDKIMQLIAIKIGDSCD